MRRFILPIALVAACGPASGPPAGDDVGPDAPAGDGRNLDARQPDAVIPTVPPEIDGQLVINEVMAANALSITDESGAAGDWFELYNPTDQDLSLHGYAVTDDLAQPLKFHINNAIIRARGHLVFWADERPEAGPFHVGFKLDGTAGQIALVRPDGTFIDRVAYGEQETDFSAARTPDGSDQWAVTWHVSPGEANPDGDGEPMGLEVPSAPPEAIPAAGDLTEHILGYDELPRLEILVSAAGVSSLLADPFTDVEATLVFEGRHYGPVGLRLKGQNSFQPFDQKPSLRVNIDQYNEDAEFWGLKDLTLNNMSLDFSMMHERLAYWVMRGAGVPSSRANHLLLTVNGQSYGLYANVETVKKRLLGRWFTDNTGPLFEGTDVDFAPQYVSEFEHEAGDDDRTLLAGLAMALTMPSADAAITAAGGFADLDRFRRFWAVSSVIGQFDALPYSTPGDDFYVYADPVSGRLSFIPWGMDETFYSGSFDVTAVVSVLARRCKESPACWQQYQAQVWEVQAMTESLDLAGERLRVMDQIAPYTTQDTRKPYTDQQVTEFQGALYWFISQRRTKLNEMFNPPPSPPPQP